jgi:hypothetical protein
MSIILNSFCIVQHNFDKAQAFKGILNVGVEVDLMIVDILESLSIPMVSSPAMFILEWNKLGEDFLQTIFDFASSLLHDNEVLLLFHLDNLQLRADIRGFMKAYHFSLFKEFMELNYLQMTSGRDASKIVSESCIVEFTKLLDTCFIDLSSINCISFFIQLLVRNYPTVPSSTFLIRSVVELDFC